jgi:hypothetical protein
LVKPVDDVILSQLLEQVGAEKERVSRPLTTGSEPEGA